jgi:hypothetical protein
MMQVFESYVKAISVVNIQIPWLQKQKSRFRFLELSDFRVTEGLKGGPIRLVSIIEELLERHK